MEIYCRIEFPKYNKPKFLDAKVRTNKKESRLQNQIYQDEIQYACWMQKFGLPQFAEEIPLLNSTKMELIEPKGDSFMELIGPEVTETETELSKGFESMSITKREPRKERKEEIIDSYESEDINIYEDSQSESEYASDSEYTKSIPPFEGKLNS